MDKIELEINGKSCDRDFVMKADYDRAKAELEDRELEYHGLEKKLDRVVKESEELEKSCLFFMRNNEEFEKEYREVIECRLEEWEIGLYSFIRV